MVNYKRVVCEVAVLLTCLAVAFAAPAADCDEKKTHYDQRQNGTENFRLSIDGMVIAIAPADALVEAASDFVDLLDIPDLEEYLKPPSSSNKPVTSESKPEIPSDSKPEPEKIPSDSKPEPEKIISDSKPDAEKPADPPLSDVSLPETKPQRKEANAGKQEKAQRLKHRLANFLIPLLRRTRHH
ncbi:uncharacterized protein LOC112044220 [Bicyclus anynana]|uniref:Uncharacterized protein LOC112044220 n=1 Tax=Bicyclus anynana TaxID=110368 RepID=A0A6J1MYU4_BICAN|nr:uncharacterized protein LOC112044220 [Bicyclus anynana]